MARVKMQDVKNIVLIAHDSRKKDLLEWVEYNRDVLKEHRLFATGTTGALIAKRAALEVTRFKSGPRGLASLPRTIRAAPRGLLGDSRRAHARLRALAGPGPRVSAMAGPSCHPVTVLRSR
jgi:hypothetical protein